ncbi:MAG: carbon storage regulator CsrA [Thermogutta sp.]|uniref:carbon storage regulator CsrA n=1 Tax=Thermogutta sp. TaxID=1962930 RepID=UPI00198F7BCF|nr:carbon storage regulator CsrA [Thermogutta sp.]MBC7354555.1 carbon storage regulator CsrA [Thermogutta sp.]GIX01700.1 MAG: carbon storage regulator [Thermogutta sp.]
MLVLSRKKNESIIIDDQIVIMVVDIRGDRVRLGIEAPKHVTVHRREVYEMIQADKKRTQETPNTETASDSAPSEQTPVK